MPGISQPPGEAGEFTGEPAPSRACERCLARAWLLNRLSGHLERARSRVTEVLALPDDELIAALGGRQKAAITAELHSLDPARLRQEAAAARLEVVCRCDPAYPTQLRELPSSPSVLYIAGGLDGALELLATDTVAIVGARRASGYGLDVARSLARGLAAAGVPVISGMALGVDSAAHAGALSARGSTIAVLPGGADRAYPASRRALHARIVASGAVVSELPPGSPVARWSPPARNRIIAALAKMTILVEAAQRSGALLTATYARTLHRRLAAVPGRVTASLSAGPNELIREGAALVRGPQDVLDELFGVGVVSAVEQGARPPLTDELARLLGAVSAGHDTVGALIGEGFAPDRVLAGLSQLELAGYVRRDPGGRFTPVT